MWNTLWDFFEEHTWDPVGSIKVYIARRFGRDVRTVGAEIDSFLKERIEASERRKNPGEYEYYAGYN